jgi:hypothetical protein
METNSSIIAYRDFERRLLEVLNKNYGEDSLEEEAILDEADSMWFKMSRDEQEYICTVNGPYFNAICEWRRKFGIKFLNIKV